MSGDKDFLNMVDQGYIGLTKPKVTKQKDDDPYLFPRLKQAKQLGVTMDELEGYPDELSDHSDDQGYE